MKFMMKPTALAAVVGIIPMVQSLPYSNQEVGQKMMHTFDKEEVHFSAVVELDTSSVLKSLDQHEELKVFDASDQVLSSRLEEREAEVPVPVPVPNHSMISYRAVSTVHTVYQ